jgi:hypothetical protein
MLRFHQNLTLAQGFFFTVDAGFSIGTGASFSTSSAQLSALAHGADNALGEGEGSGIDEDRTGLDGRHMRSTVRTADLNGDGAQHFLRDSSN